MSYSARIADAIIDRAVRRLRSGEPYLLERSISEKSSKLGESRSRHGSQARISQGCKCFLCTQGDKS